jgi:hypothetical protein
MYSPSPKMQIRLQSWVEFVEPAEERALVVAEPLRYPTLYMRQQRALAKAARAKLHLYRVGYMPLFTGHRVYQTTQTDWVVLNVAEDPLLQHPDKFPIPRKPRAQLQVLLDAGIEFDAIFIAHEVAPGSVREDLPLPLAAILPPPPKETLALTEKLGNVSSALWNLPTRLMQSAALATTTTLTASAHVTNRAMVEARAETSCAGSRMTPSSWAQWSGTANWRNPAKPRVGSI